MHSSREIHHLWIKHLTPCSPEVTLRNAHVGNVDMDRRFPLDLTGLSESDCRPLAHLFQKAVDMRSIWPVFVRRDQYYRFSPFPSAEPSFSPFRRGHEGNGHAPRKMTTTASLCPLLCMRLPH